MNGTYMQPCLRSTPNSSLLDNYSTRGNVNPYSGNPVYVSPYPSGTYGTRSRSLFNTGPFDDGND